MAIPWLGLLDTLLDVTSLALSRKSRRAQADDSESTAIAGRPSGSLEARMTGVIVAALKEAFDRDAKRVELEREQAERERIRAERVLRLELLRQAGERDVGGPIGARILLGGGWLLLLIALSLSFGAQARVGRALARIDDSSPTSGRQEDLASGAAGAVAPWLIVLGLAAVGLAMLLV
jgi:hypothetical protein